MYHARQKAVGTEKNSFALWRPPQSAEPFDASMMVYFRKRITPQMLQEINERIHTEQVKKNKKLKRKLKRMPNRVR